MGLVSCTGKSTEVLSLSSGTDTSSGYIATISTDGNNRSFSIYDINGNYLNFTHFREENVLPRGLTVLDDDRILMSGDVTDSIYSLDLSSNKTLFYGSSQFAGGIYDLEYDSTTDLIFAAESNNIEVFDTDGNRITAMRIPNVTGACTLNTPVGMAINSSGNLVVTDVGGTDEILFYDISTTPPTCLNTIVVPNNPFAVLQHSNGYLYIATSTDDRILRTDADGSNSQVIWDADTTVINRPTALAELPNGNILVGSSDTDTIEQITPAGERVGTTPFIQTPFTLNVSDIVIIGGQSE